MVRHRRRSPYSRLEALRRSRQGLLGLVLLTAGLGVVLSLLSDLLSQDLSIWFPWSGWCYALVLVLVLILAGLVVPLFYARSESRRVRIEVQIPYHLPAEGRPGIVERRSYGVTVHARRAFMRRYRRGSPELDRWLAGWRQAEAEGIPFQRFIAEDQAALVQCLLLYVLHRYGNDSLGHEAAYGWWKVDLPARLLAMDDLPPGLRDNPFLRADQQAERWRLWWPEEVQLELAPDPELLFPRWRLRHRRYGRVEIRCYPHLTVAGRGSQVWRVLTRRLRLDRRSQLFIIGSRLEAQAHFRWTFWPGGEGFHNWATGLLTYLEEALDWGYYLETRTDRLVAALDERVGWVPSGTSVFDKLQEIEGRLERLEARGVDGGAEADMAGPAEEPGEPLVV